jgi:hypothetical protein
LLFPPSSRPGGVLPPEETRQPSSRFRGRHASPDHFKPVYLIFDQLEELFIFGTKEEREEFIGIIKEIVTSDIQCKLIFVVRDKRGGRPVSGILKGVGY